MAQLMNADGPVAVAPLVRVDGRVALPQLTDAPGPVALAQPTNADGSATAPRRTKVDELVQWSNARKLARACPDIARQIWWAPRLKGIPF